MHRLTTLILLVPLPALAQWLPQQSLRLHPPALELGACSLAVVDTSLWVVNASTQALTLDTPFALSGRVSVLEAPAAVAPGDSARLRLRLDLREDLDLEDALLLPSAQLAGLPALALQASPRHANPMWAGAANLWGSALKSFLNSQVVGHTDLGYSGARGQMFGDFDNVNGQVQCVYTATWITTDGIPDANIMNTEHTWPQSMGAEGTARSDLHHLYPTLNQPNAIRGNLPFGEVVNQDWSQGGSLRGTDAGGVQVFEPREPHKGDAARSLFYFALRYGNLSSFLTYQEPTLRIWALADTVSQKELDRNDAIDALQHNRNPFVDHMGWVQRMASLAGTADLAPTRLLQMPGDTLHLAAAVGDTCWVEVPLLSTGNSTLLLGYMQSADPQVLSVHEVPANLPAGRMARVRLAWHPIDNEARQVQITLSTNAQNGAMRHLQVRGVGTGTAVAPVAPHPGGWRLMGVHPNPFNPATTISLQVEHPTHLRLALHDLRGARLWTQALSLPAGTYRHKLNSGPLPSGRYFLRVEDESGHIQSLPLTLLR